MDRKITYVLTFSFYSNVIFKWLKHSDQVSKQSEIQNALKLIMDR